jgi:DNA-binding IclR family transcriptional regulator
MPDMIREVSTALPEATVTFSRSIGGDVIAVLRISPERPGVVERQVDRIMGAYNTASSLLFQAFWCEEDRQSYRRRYPFEEYGTHIWRDLDHVDDFLASVREKGYAALAFTERRILAVASPVFGEQGGIQAAVGASVPQTGDDVELEQKVIRILLPATEKISERAGI